jgi:hypothetical protein
MSGILKTGGDGKAMLSFSGERTSWQLFRKQLRSSCDQNGMGWAITVGHAMNQFLIHIAASNAAAAAASKKDIPANFEDFEAAEHSLIKSVRLMYLSVYDIIVTSPRVILNTSI